MNILMLHPHDINSKFEPWTVRVVYIARELERSGHKVKLVYFPLEWKGQAELRISEGITAIPLCRLHGPHILLANIIRVLRLAGWCDIVHFQKCFYHASIPAMTAALLRNKHLHYDWDDWELKIYEVSTFPGFGRDLIRWFIGRLEGLIPLAADTVSVASSRLKKECLRIIKQPKLIFDAHVGADLDRFNPRVSGSSVREKYRIDKPLVLYLGQLHGGQYVELFMLTARKLLDEYRQDVLFMIVGDGYMAGELKKKAAQMGLDGRLIFTGAVPHEDIPRYIAASDVCVACFESNDVTACKSPLKIVEYLASGKAIVASNVGEVAAMLGDAGVLVEAGNSDALAKGITRVLADKNLREALEKKARIRAEQEYNWRVTADSLLKAYNTSFR